MPGGDSTGYTALSPWGSACPFVDTSRELVMLRFSFDSTNQTYGIQTLQARHFKSITQIRTIKKTSGNQQLRRKDYSIFRRLQRKQLAF
jgi:hypothetical protein